MNQRVDRQLHRCSGTAATHVKDRLGQRIDHRSRLLQRACVSSDHRGQGSLLDQRNAARDRCVEEVCTPGLELGSKSLDRLGIDGAGLDDDGPGTDTGCGALTVEMDCEKSSIIGQARHDHVCAGGRGRR